MESRPLLVLKNKKTGHIGNYQIDQDCVKIGRDRSSYIVLEERTVSRHHAEIIQQGTQYFLQDLGGSNGTWLNRRRLRPQEKVLLTPGDVIGIDDYEISFHLSTNREPSQMDEVTDTDILEIKMVKKLLKAIDKDQAPSLEVIDGPHVGIRYVLEAKNQEVLIGRDVGCEFNIDSDVISRKHARLVKRWDAVRLVDLGSKNGTYVNKAKIKEKQLHDGDIIHLGTLALAFRNPQELSLEIMAPPRKPAKQEQTGPEIAMPPIAIKQESRAARKQEEGQPAQGQFAQGPEHPPEEAEESATTYRGLQLSAVEVLLGLLGLGVVALCVWGLWILLK